MYRDNENGERVAVPHLFATGKRNSDGLIVQSLEFSETEGEREGGQERERESVAC